MGARESQALARLLAEDEEFKAAMVGTATVEDAIRLAAEHGIDVTAEALTMRESTELSEAELDVAAGGTLPTFVPSDLCTQVAWRCG